MCFVVLVELSLVNPVRQLVRAIQLEDASDIVLEEVLVEVLIGKAAQERIVTHLVVDTPQNLDMTIYIVGYFQMELVDILTKKLTPINPSFIVNSKEQILESFLIR